MSAMSTLFLLLALLCVFHLSPLCEMAVCYVKPTEPHNATCPSEPCHTLDEYVRNSTRYFVSNTVFMFLTGYHHLSYDNLTVSAFHNITLKPYIEKSYVFIDSELHLSLVFKSISDIVIRDMTFQILGIRFENSTNITLTGLTAENGTAFVLSNVFGAVSLLHLKIKSTFKFEWAITQSQYLPNTTVLLCELDLYNNGRVSISGCIPGKLVLMNSTFSQAKGIDIELGPSCSDMLFVCENTQFNDSLHGIYVTVQTSQQNKHTMAVALHNVWFVHVDLTIVLENVQNATISDCHFRRSIFLGAISAINSILSFIGNITFINNHSSYAGGAITLIGDSHILIPDPNNTYILFKNNTASNVGGAIYFSSYNIIDGVTRNCKMFVEQTSNEIVFNFSKNFANNGGNAIYGANLDAIPCYSPNGILIQNLSEVILNVSSFFPSFAHNSSVISSDPNNLCFCKDDKELGDCSGFPLHVYPGQNFGLPVAALGDMGGLVEWSVYATVHNGTFSNEVQHSQSTNAERCTYFHYTILSNKELATLAFSLIYQSVDDFFTHNNKYYHKVHLLDCPLGFALSNNNGCECHKYLTQNIESIICNVTELSIQRQGTTWIGVLERNTSDLVFSTVCPFSFCSKSKVKLQSNEFGLDEDIQCNDNRSGILCGGCKKKFSVALGSNRCLPGCSNNSLSLVIAFAAVGVVLVFFIKILNLTVSQGTINGLIFYANIVGAEQTMLFSSTYEGFLSVFIAWMNLDFGIETCFFDGMDAYAKAWLQFVFPVYIWAIALFVIILAHYSIHASKFFGDNSVPVLVTLILLSYSKLLRAIISALSFTDILFLNGAKTSVWEKDGSILYLSSKHIPLFVFAVAVLLLLWLPFTLILTSIQWLQKGTHYKVVCWVIKLRPFFDAFTGPLKDKHRYWVGALLLARCCLLLVFYLYTANGSGVAFVSIIFTVLIISIFLAATGSVYRSYHVAVLELSYILNLGILATGKLYVQYINDKGNQEALVMTSVGIAFLQFMVTVIYHAYVQMEEPMSKLKNRITRMYGHGIVRNISTPEHADYKAVHINEQPILQSKFQDDKYREPLFEYLND